MKKALPLLALCLGPFLTAHAQNRCATDQYVAWQESIDPSLIVQKQLVEQQVQNFILQNAGQKSGIVTIPVVFHILWQTSAQNISNTQVLAQIDQLNIDYMGANPDTANVPGPFKSFVAQPQIQFCLAQQDPQGNPTDGIVRKNTTVSQFTTNNAVKYSSQGGDNAWPYTSYLNLWVCNLGSGLLGYAQPPGGLGATDGVVVHYGSVGSTQHPSSFNWGGANFNWGRTATHEIGHWLGLWHTFQGGCTNSNCSSQGDLICDTPPVSGPSFGCPNFPQISCNNGPNGGMFMNFMDYPDDNCMIMFTDSQSIRMNSVLNTTRSSIKNSIGCVPVGIAENAFSLSVDAWPNPAVDYLDIMLTGDLTGKAEVVLQSVTGAAVYRRDATLRNGDARLRLDVGTYARGMYILGVTTKDGTLKKKLLLMR